VTAKSLLEACLRMKPDRIFLAEMRGDECFYFVRLAASGHPGSITSVHAGSCALAFEQMSLMIRESVAVAACACRDQPAAERRDRCRSCTSIATMPWALHLRASTTNPAAALAGGAGISTRAAPSAWQRRRKRLAGAWPTGRRSC
jgi:hypothetical protein